MHAGSTIKEWMHQLHDETVKAAHFTGHMVHEKAFWGILAILAMIAALFTLVVLFGSSTAHDFSLPIPYGTYH